MPHVRDLSLKPEKMHPPFSNVCSTCLLQGWHIWKFLQTAWRQLATAAINSIRGSKTSFHRVHHVCLLCPEPVGSCRYSIHARDHAELKEAVARYPEPVDGAQGVYYCGYNSERSFGGSAWLIQRDSGNVLVDSPRFDPKLVKNIKVSSSHKADMWPCQILCHWRF